MVVFPKAKINIGLRITRKRTDGFHDIETIFYPVGLCDALEFVVSGEPEEKDLLTVTGIDTGSITEDNLVIKTLKNLHGKYSFPFIKTHLHKIIPPGAGLGGGSSDAAFLLKAVNRHFELGIDEESLKAEALELGSDCPFFIDCIPAYASGRGEILKPIRHVLSGYYILLLNPGSGINTREAYQNCRPESPSTSLLQIADLPVTEWKELITNDFEPFAFQKHPVIGEIKKGLYRGGALFSSMSGSGSTVYGIFSEKPELSHELSKYMIWEGVL
jgi:4-diphosphocytidyl-2-C-methyl-D-erythritol kinase